MADSDDQDPTAWLGDPIGVYDSDRGGVAINVPPADRRTVVISLVDAPLIDDQEQTATAFVRLSLDGARGLLRGLEAAIGQLEEHSES